MAAGRNDNDDKGAEFNDLLQEHRTFPPPTSFRHQARIQDEQICSEADLDLEAFWAKFADELVRSRRWDTVLAADLPKTRSGKIMRRLLRDIAEDKALGDTTVLGGPTLSPG